jgi:predicted metal-binding membrane protein
VIEDALAPFLGTWTLMMAAMMLPSAAPMVLLHRLGSDGRVVQRELRSAVFVAGYLLVWGSVGIAVWGAARAAEQVVPHEARPTAIAAILLIAGIYQLTPLKSVCLRACRTPADFLLTHWYRGLGGSFRTGVEHGLYCLGCCWALMAVFVAAGAMSLVWAVVIAAAVFVEKVLPRGVTFGRLMGLVLIGLAVAVLVRPELAGTTGDM